MSTMRKESKFGAETQLNRRVRQRNRLRRRIAIEVISMEVLDPAAARALALKKFRSYVQSIIYWMRLYLHHSSQVQDYMKAFGDIQMMIDQDREKQNGMLFSVSAYKADKTAKVNLETLAILRNNPCARTEEDIRPIESGLLGYEAFSAYTPEIIRSLAELSWYQEFEPGTVIVREGDIPLYYYFIISGCVLVSIIDRQKMTANTVATLSRGDSFGELSIIDGTRRKSTIIAKDRVGLLLMDAVDYLEVFMNGGIKFMSDPFLKTIRALEGFPFHNLPSNPREIVFSYFKKRTTLVQDSTCSEWIFIVKSGSCLVQMAISKQEDRKSDSAEKDGKAELLDPEASHETIVRRAYRAHLHKLKNAKITQKTTKGEELQLPLIQTNVQKELSLIGREHSKLTSSTTSAYFQIGNNFKHGMNADKKTTDPPAASTTYWKDQKTVQGQRSLATDLNSEYFHKLQLESEAMERHIGLETKEKITIQRLEKGMIFGLVNYYFEKQPAVQLVSDGCECYCIRKSQFFELADSRLLMQMGNSLRPYPNEEDVIRKRREHKQWLGFRDNFVQHTRSVLLREAVDVHDCRTRFPTVPTAV